MNQNIDFSNVDEQSVKGRQLANENHASLIKYGFLDWVSPNLYFGEFEENELLPPLREWSWLNDWKANKEQALEKYGEYLVVGSGPDDEPIVLKPNKAPIYLISNTLELKLINSSYEKAVLTASTFMDMIDKAIELDSDSVQNRTIPENLIEDFISNLNNIESNENNSMWVQWANERCKTYNKAKQAGTR
ncbi:hypothetical protein P3339_17155 [Microbulbifer sp. MLAF003]|uniref:hypothetical protein n=1 Tax=Microbulbifer sp. MLAF003 TaxID=3032582 RepID=UPI0024AD1AC9|nr:hypothetical protein [Microbulbifer sp. MLAF003]WHI50159.1 hypothetical protein P3339_17155 [Microbulbifer sp. MLAF003]